MEAQISRNFHFERPDKFYVHKNIYTPVNAQAYARIVHTHFASLLLLLHRFRWSDLVEELLQKAEEWYAEGDDGIALLPTQATKV